jgi:hypothetical protein
VFSLAGWCFVCTGALHPSENRCKALARLTDTRASSDAVEEGMIARDLQTSPTNNSLETMRRGAGGRGLTPIVSVLQTWPAVKRKHEGTPGIGAER